MSTTSLGRLAFRSYGNPISKDHHPLAFALDVPQRRAVWTKK